MDHKIVFSTGLRIAVVGALILVSQLTFVTFGYTDSAPPGGQAAWSKYFSGPAIIPDPEVNLEKMSSSTSVYTSTKQNPILVSDPPA